MYGRIIITLSFLILLLPLPAVASDYDVKMGCMSCHQQTKNDLKQPEPVKSVKK